MVLYEYFNTTNQTIPTFSAHENFVTDIKDPGCSLVITLPSDSRCSFVERTEGCSEEVQYINYVEFLFCTLEPDTDFKFILSVLLLLLISCLFFAMLGVIADKFFCPSLTYLSDALGLSETLAGVTLLAFGNGAVDVLTCFASLDKEDTGMMYSELVGASLFVLCVVGGTIIAISPFKLFSSAFVRDICFLLLANVYIDLAIYTNNMTILESSLILMIYFVYIIVVFTDQYLMKKAAKKYKDTIQNRPHDESLTSILSEEKLKDINRQVDTDYAGGYRASIRSSQGIRPSARSLQVKGIRTGANDNLWEQFLEGINPIDKEEFEESSLIGKIIEIVLVPFTLFLLLLLPIVEYGRENNGWTKLLNCFQIVSFPLVFYIINPDLDTSIFGIFIILVVTVPISVVVFHRTRTDRAPNGHVCFALIGIIGSIASIAYVAGEVVCLLTVVGIALKASTSFLGCTLLAWGNSIGDLISNMTLAKHGYQKMAFAACVGGPIFNIIFGLGITFTYKTIEGKNQDISQGSMGKTCSIFVTISSILILLATFLTNYQARRSIGIYMISIYILFFIFTLCDVFGLIHAYGTDHSEEHHF